MLCTKRLHEQHGYTFVCITSLSLDENAAKLREMNLQKMFGKTAFSKVICLDTGADKDEALSKYAGSNCYWLEDKPENATAGLRFGLRPILMEHGHNMNADVTIPQLKIARSLQNCNTTYQNCNILTQQPVNNNNNKRRLWIN